jgi:hypothetical protein
MVSRQTDDVFWIDIFYLDKNSPSRVKNSGCEIKHSESGHFCTGGFKNDHKFDFSAAVHAES